MSIPSRPGILLLLLAFATTALLAEAPPEGGGAGGLRIDTKDGTFCGIKLGGHGLDTLSKLPYPSQQELKDVQESFKQSMKTQTYFRTLVPGVADVKLGFNRFDGTLIEIQCQSPDFRTIDGLGVGSTIAEFTKAYGPPVQTLQLRTGAGFVYHAGVLRVFVYPRNGDTPESKVFRMIIQRFGN